LAATPAWFEPGSRHVYHVNTYGHLVGELVRRASGGSSPSSRLAALVEPLGLEMWFGAPPEVHDRCADVLWAGGTGPGIDPHTLDGELRMNALAHFNPPGYSSIGVVNTAEWRA